MTVRSPGEPKLKRVFEELPQRENDIIPIEVKSEANTASRSMKKFKELFPNQVKLRVRFSLNNLKLDDDVLNLDF